MREFYWVSIAILWVCIALNWYSIYKNFESRRRYNEQIDVLTKYILSKKIKDEGE